MTRAQLLAMLVCFAAPRCACEATPDTPADAGIDTSAPDARADLPDMGRNDAAPSAACGDSTSETVDVAGWSVTLDHRDGAWRATPPGSRTALLRGPAACMEGGALSSTDAAPDIQAAFGNFRIDLPPAEAWRQTVAGELPRLVATQAGPVRLEYDLGALVFSAGPRGGLQIEVDQELPTAAFRVACQTEESFFGLGTQVTGMDLRGRTFPLWTQEQGNGKPEGGGNFPFNNLPEAAYAPMGVLHSSAGWSAVVSHDGFTEIDLCHGSAAWLEVRSHQANPGFVFLDGSPRERMTAVTEYTGRVRDDVPAWIFGLWLDAVTGPERLALVADTLRAEGIPASAIWSEDWIGGESSRFGFRLSYDWVWDEAQYPDLPTIVEGLHARGFAFLAYFNSFVPEPTTIWPEAIAGGFLVQDADANPVTFLDPAFRNAGLVDLYNPEALAWLRSYQMTAVTELGVDGWMADFSEWYPLEGVEAWARHNPYPLRWQEANDANLRAARPDGNYVFFPRSGWASIHGGTGGVAPVMWGGDQNTDWKFDDGFPTIIPLGAHVGLSGVPIYGSDIAGYNTVGNNIPNTSKELWFRWAATAAFHPLMRTHHGGDECANWNFDRDAESIAHLRRWSSVHTLLFPEFQRLYREATIQGWPISRHPWLVEPEQPALWSGSAYAWFLGDDLFVAPVLVEGATSRAVTLPGPGWWPLFGDTPLTAAEVTADAPVSEVPVFVRPGRALVLLQDAVDSFYGATQADVSTLDSVESRYRVALYPDATGQARSAGEVPFAVGARGLSTYDASAPSFAGTPLPVCDEAVLTSCTDGETIYLRGVTAGSLLAGGATIDVDAATPVDVQVALGGTAWGALAMPTPFAPNPEAASWCPPEE